VVSAGLIMSFLGKIHLMGDCFIYFVKSDLRKVFKKVTKEKYMNRGTLFVIMWIHFLGDVDTVEVYCASDRI
jgi:hypothetical protein